MTLGLAASRPSTHLTVEEIVRDAGVNRSTFYTHAENLTMLLNKAVRAALARIDTSWKPSVALDRRSVIEAAIAPFISYITQAHNVYRTALTDEVAAGSLFQVLTEHLARRIHTVNPSTPPEVAAATAAAATEVIKQAVADPNRNLDVDAVLTVLEIALAL